jgi:hypothetical protein
MLTWYALEWRMGTVTRGLRPLKYLPPMLQTLEPPALSCENGHLPGCHPPMTSRCLPPGRSLTSPLMGASQIAAIQPSPNRWDSSPQPHRVRVPCLVLQCTSTAASLLLSMIPLSLLLMAQEEQTLGPRELSGLLQNGLLTL